MKKMTILLLILSLQNMALAVEMAPAVTEDPKQVKALEQKKEEQKTPIEVKREELKKKHANKKKNAVAPAKPAASSATSSDNSKIKGEDQEIKALNRDEQQQEKKDDKAPLGK